MAGSKQRPRQKDGVAGGNVAAAAPVREPAAAKPRGPAPPASGPTAGGADTARRTSLANAAAAAMSPCDCTRDLESIPVAILDVRDEIKRGRFKRVHRGKYKRRNVVILRYTKECETNELFIIGLLANRGSSRFIPEMYGVCYEESMTSVVQELAPFGSLKNSMRNAESSARMSPGHRVHLSFQIARAMAFLQSVRVVHADLSCRNVLLFRLEEEMRLCVAKITDFGLAVDLPEGIDFEHRKQPQATRWCSPETVVDLKLSHRSDVWSFGATAWELFAGVAALPWPRLERRVDVADRLKSMAELAARGDEAAKAEAVHIVEDGFPLPTNCPNEAHDVFLSCLKANENDRPTFAQLMDSLKGLAGDDDEAAFTPRSVDSKLISPRSSPRALMSTPSTTDTLEGLDAARRHCILEGMSSDPTIGGRGFRTLRSFLESPRAVEALGEDAVSELFQEVEEAAACREKLYTSASSLHSPEQSTRAIRAAGPGGQQLRGSSSTDFLMPLTATTGLVSRGRSPPPPTRGSWTLTSFLRPALLRQDFETEADARAAFEAAASTDGTCVLRDPQGAQAAARSWAEPASPSSPCSHARGRERSRSKSNAVETRRISPPAASPPRATSSSAEAAADNPAAAVRRYSPPAASPPRSTHSPPMSAAPSRKGSKASASGQAPLLPSTPVARTREVTLLTPSPSTQTAFVAKPPSVEAPGASAFGPPVRSSLPAPVAAGLQDQPARSTMPAPLAAGLQATLGLRRGAIPVVKQTGSRMRTSSR